MALEVVLIALGFFLPVLWLVAVVVVPIVLSVRNERRYRYTGTGKAARSYPVEAPDGIDNAWGVISTIFALVFVGLLVLSLFAR